MNSILVVDDDSDSRAILAKFFRGAGFQVRAAPNGREALIALAGAVPDVIVLDVMMPEMNGIEFLGVVRSYLRWAQLPIIVLTAYDSPDITEAAHAHGVRSIFRKASYQLSDLLRCVHRVRQDPEATCETC